LAKKVFQFLGVFELEFFRFFVKFFQSRAVTCVLTLQFAIFGKEQSGLDICKRHIELVIFTVVHDGCCPDRPIPDVVVYIEPLPRGQISEKLLHFGVVRSLFELETAAILHIEFELLRALLAEILDWRTNLKFFNFFVAGCLVREIEVLPGQ